MKPDTEIDPVVLEVLNTAALLDTTEFNVFCLAYTRWFGRRASVEFIEPHFNAYMFSEIVPFWVRHFTRHIMKLYTTGRLNLQDYGLKSPPARARMIFLGRFYTFLLILILVILFVATSSSDHLETVAKNCYFPPCY